jgi:hypothetical protein
MGRIIYRIDVSIYSMCYIGQIEYIEPVGCIYPPPHMACPCEEHDASIVTEYI